MFSAAKLNKVKTSGEEGFAPSLSDKKFGHKCEGEYHLCSEMSAQEIKERIIAKDSSLSTIDV
jgi:uncharacterized protein YcbX